MSFMSKGLLEFSASSLSNSDQVASFLYASDGTALTHTGGALDVNVANAIDVALDGIYDNPGNLTPDSAGAIFHVRGGTVDITSQTLRVTGASPASDDVDPANMIALDTNGMMMAWDGSAWDRLTTTGGALDVEVASAVDVNLLDLVADDAADAGGSLKAGSRAVDGALTAVSASDDRADLLSDMYRRVYVNTSPNIAAQLSSAAVTTSAVQIAPTALGGRTRILVQNLSNQEIYIGPDNTVTVGTGIEVRKNGALELPWGEDVPIWAIGDTGITADVRVLEVA